MAILPSDVFSQYESGLIKEPIISNLDKKLVLVVAPTGSFIKRELNKYQPYSPKEIAEQVKEAYQAGATVWHVHCRDEQGFPSKDPLVIAGTVDLVQKDCPDIILSQNVIGAYKKHGIDMIRPIVDGLKQREEITGSSYIDTAVVTPYSRGWSDATNFLVTKEILQEEVNYILSNNIIPEFQIHNYSCLNHVREWIIEPGIIPNPIMNVILGFHGPEQSTPAYPSPWGELYLFGMLNLLPAGSLVGVTAGGRNWLPMTVTAIMQGVSLIRIGMEDALWMYPHKNEMLKSCGEIVNKVATIARELGRDIATPMEARQILGL